MNTQGDEQRMTLPETGWSRDQILSALTEMKSRDLATEGGAAFAYVYDSGEREAAALAGQAYAMFLGANGLDPTAFPSLLRMENEVVGLCARHLGGGPEASGSFTSGGTESLILAVKTARDWARVHRPEVVRPEIIVPVTAHASLHKAAHYLDVALVSAPVDPHSFKADVAAMRAAITENTILLTASAASYAHGVIDPIAEIGQLALERGLLFHVDGCIGAWLLPYFRRLGAEVPGFDLSVPGVTSISMDLHKYGYAPKGASVIVYRDKALRRHQLYACADWTGYAVINATVQSTKSGGPLAAAWTLLHALGDAGYLELARRTLAATRQIVAGVRAIPGLRVLGEPEMSLLAFTSDEGGGPLLFAIADAMTARGWLVQPQLQGHGAPASLHLTISAGHLAVVDRFLVDLRAAVAEVRAAGPDPMLGMLLGAAGGLDFASLGDAGFTQALALVGVKDGQLPERMAPIHALLDTLPPAVREAALLAFLNDLYTAHGSK
jgi:sphinganine-1-phosphate aldolase